MEKFSMLAHCCGRQNDAAAMENTVEFPQTLKIAFPYDPVTPVPGI